MKENQRVVSRELVLPSNLSCGKFQIQIWVIRHPTKIGSENETIQYISSILPVKTRHFHRTATKELMDH
ncbi:unnamed protein product [Rhizophagus irregularis]|nr:unnamed protein product [Rhizophagus irregularis]CAB5377735.1 unnamed protein product [Rhizophagus irregularis]